LTFAAFHGTWALECCVLQPRPYGDSAAGSQINHGDMVAGSDAAQKEMRYPSRQGDGAVADRFAYSRAPC